MGILPHQSQSGIAPAKACQASDTCDWTSRQDEIDRLNGAGRLFGQDDAECVQCPSRTIESIVAELPDGHGPRSTNVATTRNGANEPQTMAVDNGVSSGFQRRERSIAFAERPDPMKSRGAFLVGGGVYRHGGTLQFNSEGNIVGCLLNASQS